MSGNLQGTIQLPSRGLLYSKEACPDGAVTLRAMTTADESFVRGATRENVNAMMNKLIAGCITDGWKAPLGRMVALDRMHVLYQLRTITYGGEYNFDYSCPTCGFESAYRIDLSMLPITEMNEDTTEPIYTTLPIGGQRIGWRFLRVDDETEAVQYVRRAKQRAQDSDPVEEFQFARRIISIDSEEGMKFESVLKFVRTMHARDRRVWEKEIEARSFGLSGKLELTCKGHTCGRSHIIELPLSDDFFRPALTADRELSGVYSGSVNIAYDPANDAVHHRHDTPRVSPRAADRRVAEEGAAAAGADGESVGKKGDAGHAVPLKPPRFLGVVPPSGIQITEDGQIIVDGDALPAPKE
jgi:hypothetical protein